MGVEKWCVRVDLDCWCCGVLTALVICNGRVCRFSTTCALGAGGSAIAAPSPALALAWGGLFDCIRKADRNNFLILCHRVSAGLWGGVYRCVLSVAHVKDAPNAGGSLVLVFAATANINKASEVVGALHADNTTLPGD